MPSALLCGHGDIIRGLRRRVAEIDLLRAQDVLPLGTQDAEILSWAAAEGRVLISNDRNTMVGLAYQRAAAGDPAPGLIATTNNRSARPLTTSCSSRSTCRRTRSNSKS